MAGNQAYPPTYEIVETQHGPAIRCLVCGRISYNAADLREKYCAACRLYHGVIGQNSNEKTSPPSTPTQ